MIDRQRLLADLKPLVSRLEDDLRHRLDENPELDAPWRDEYEAAREAQRTGATYDAWRDEHLTQVAAAWVLGSVFVRFLEDNGLVDEPRLSGPRERREHALDHHLLYFRQHPAETDREYLLAAFEEVAALPGAEEVFDRKHNPLWRLGPSGDGAREVLELWQRREAATGELVHDFTDPEWDTRFLGDLYQDLSEAARKRYALLQTPEFVESFLLDRTLEPALEEFGLERTRLLDPTCGSGHFLLGAFARLLDRWLGAAPEVNVRELTQRALDGVAGVDVNPFAVAIARFRLLVAALRGCGEKRLATAPAFKLHVACGDSLLHGPRFGVTRGTQATIDPKDDPLRFVYETEDREMLREVLGRRYAAVVGNPPYITVKDSGLNQAYRDRYGSCHRQYSLGVPFTERFFELAESGAGYVGMITANSFMKREFGKKLIEDLLPVLDLTHVIDTSGAFIPGHATPTVILIGRNRRPVKTTVRAALGIRGEPEKPEDPSRGKVWTSITGGIELPGSEDDFVSIDDKSRKLFASHPWTLSGGGALELKEFLETKAVKQLSDLISDLGRTMHTGEDDVYFLPPSAARTLRLSDYIVPLVTGEDVRDFQLDPKLVSLFPYNRESAEILEDLGDDVSRYFWRYRTKLRRRKDFGQFIEERGLLWYEPSMLFRSRYRSRLSIAFPYISTHNHFVLDCGGKVFNRHAPVIKLPSSATESDHLALLGLLNSSVGCFWLKQVCFDKGVGGIGGGIGDEGWEPRYEFDGTKIQQFPIPEGDPTIMARSLDSNGAELQRSTPAAISAQAPPTADILTRARERYEILRKEAIFQQEELDWWAYQAYDLVGDDLSWSGDPFLLELGQRAFEIVLARRIEAGEERTEWFERHDSQPITEIPEDWPEGYRQLVERRLQLIDENHDIRLIERPEYKRRWLAEPWEKQQEKALRAWLLDRLESDRIWSGEPTLRPSAWIADRLRAEPGAAEVAELLAGSDVDFHRLVSDLLTGEAVPYLAAWRYKATGLRKRRAWEEVWDLQRREDRGEDVGEIAVPPKYASADFASSTYWRLRGKLDVPKERFVSYPGSERAADPTPVYGWAGWNQLRQAQALAAFYLRMKEDEGWERERLEPLLAGLLELEPWIRQWYDAADGQSGLGDYFATFVGEEARELGVTVEAVRGWRPPAKGKGRRRTKS